MDINIGDGVAVMSAESRKNEIPKIATMLVYGAVYFKNWCRNKDAVNVILNGDSIKIHVADFELANEISQEIKGNYIDLNGGSCCLNSPTEVLKVIGMAQSLYARKTDTRAGKKGIVMLSDNDGCGFWRMRLPARFIERDGWYADITSAQVDFKSLLEYDTIFVQKFHEWDAYYILEKLKKAGKRIVYDIDDDIFNIPVDNPAAKIIKKDQQFAALETMKLADVVTVSTDYLKDMIQAGLGPKGKVEVIPNALDLVGMTSVKECGSPDGYKRIFWQGGTSHAEDWHVCIQAIEGIMKEDERVRLVLLGYLPPVVMEMVNRNPGMNLRVEHMGFSEPETYYQMIKYVRAEVGICPLTNIQFNNGKCVDSSMRVSTDCGIIEIGNVKKDMKVWRDGWKKVEGVFIDSKKEGLEIVTKHGYCLRLSQEHRMSVEGEWKIAKDFVIGDKIDMSFEDSAVKENVVCPWPSDSRMNKGGRKRKLGFKGYGPSDPYAFLKAEDGPKIEITPRWGRILGAYVGDGSVGQSTTMQISCDGIDQDWIDLLMEDFRKFGFSPHTESIVTFDGTPTRRRGVRVSNSHLARFFESLGLLRYRENGVPIRVVKVPDVIWSSPKAVIAEFLSGYFEADGTSYQCAVSVVSKSRDFLMDIHRLLLVFGIKSRFFERTHSCQTCKRTYFNITLARDAVDVFRREIGFKSKRKKEKLNIISSKKHSNSFRSMELSDEIVSIKPYEITPVDIQVQGEEFVLSGFISHNSNLKYLENTVIGVPTIASNRVPYSVIRNGVDGMLVNDNEWYNALKELLDDKEKRKGMLIEARKTVKNSFDIRQVSEQWADVLCK